MDFGICVASKIDDIGYIEKAEALGYSHAWIADSQMIWSDCYAVLALAAERTSRIKLGTGVAITGTRIAPVTAHSIATINRIAPGRTFLGIGAGNTALRLMGHRPVGVNEFGEYLRVVRALLDGQEVDFAFRGRSEPLRFLMEEQGFIATEPRIPMYVSGFGPKSQGLAGEVGDGLVMSIPPNASLFDRAIENCRRGAEAAGRDFDADSFYTSLPEEERFVTPDLIRASCLAGTAEEVRFQVRTLADAGLDQLMLLPSLATQERVIEQFHDEVMARL